MSKMPSAIEYSLYFVSAESPARERNHLEAIAQAIAGGATFVQLRDKTRSDEDFMELAKKALAVSRAAGVPFIVNDRVNVALEIGADGLHIGQSDAALKEARKLLGPESIIGVSVETVDEALGAMAGGADYLGVGPIYPTGSKADAGAPIGLEGLAAIRAAVDLPLVAIGGISKDRATEVVRAGADGIAVISAITEADNMKAAAEDLRAIITAALKERSWRR